MHGLHAKHGVTDLVNDVVSRCPTKAIQLVDASRIPTGPTISAVKVSDTQAIKEIDPAGRTLSENKMGSLGRVFKY